MVATVGLAKVEQLNLGLSAGAVAASFALLTPHFALSLAAGAALEALNFGAIHRGAQRLFEVDAATGEREVNAQIKGWVGVFSMRFLILAAAIYAVMEVGADPAAMIIGLSIVMPATMIDAWRNRPAVVDPATLPILLEDETDDDKEYWENYSIWRPGRLLTSERDDLPPKNESLMTFGIDDGSDAALDAKEDGE